MKIGNLKLLIKKVPKHIWILVLIVMIGIFLRTYHFHSWLEFRADQVRDANLAEQVVRGESSWPLFGPHMNRSGESKGTFYHLGPIYYYFQIISAKIFGDYPQVLAYPDVFFAILSMPLLYLFLRIYFSKNLSLSLTALYSVSSYFIHYSRFAWNSNLIPFFVLLFLFSLYKMLNNNEKMSWPWIVALGTAWGVGFQLHAITMILFSAIVLFVFLLSIKRSSKSWKKWAVVLLIFVVLNAGQIISEMKTGFANTKILLNFSPKSNNVPPVSKPTLLKNATDCQIEANFFFLSSYGGNNCSYGISNILSDFKVDLFSKKLPDKIYWIALLVSFLFSAAGYFLLVYYDIKEPAERKRYFLRLITIYAAVAFLIMIPLSVKQFDDLRYFTPVFFIPFILLGLFIKFISEKLSRKYMVFAVIIFALLIYSNIAAISAEASELLNKNRTCTSHSTTLGEIEPVAQYIASHSGGQKNMFVGGHRELEAAANPLIYLLRKRNLDPVGIAGDTDLNSFDQSAFIVSCRSKMTDIYSYQKIDNIYVYQAADKQ